MIIDTKKETPVEWQGRAAGRGRWTRIDPPKGETMAQRVAYLLNRKNSGGAPMYEVRALYAAPVTPEAA